MSHSAHNFALDGSGPAVHMTELEMDALTEVFNIGIGSSAALLSELMDGKVELSIPQIEFISSEDLGTILEKRASQSLVAIKQEFSGQVQGDAILLFPEDNSLDLVRGLLEHEVTREELPDIEGEALSELGNIILNSCIGHLANELNFQLDMSLPVFMKCSAKNITTNAQNVEDPVGMLLQVDFDMQEKGIQGYMVALLNLESIQELKKSIDSHLRSVGLIDDSA